MGIKEYEARVHQVTFHKVNADTGEEVLDKNGKPQRYTTNETFDIEVDVNDLEKLEAEKKQPPFPFGDMWGTMSVDYTFKGMHPDELVDFNIWEDEGEKFISFYGWDEKYQQTDTSNSVGFYQLIGV